MSELLTKVKESYLMMPRWALRWLSNTRTAAQKQDLLICTDGGAYGLFF